MSLEVRPRSDHRMYLNNYIQHTYGKQRLVKYDVTPNGPVHACTWTAIAYINNVEYGQNSNITKKAACEEAARQALLALERHGLPGENRSELSSEGEEAVATEEATGSGEA